MSKPIQTGDLVRFKPEWADSDADVLFVALEDESKGRVLVQAQVALPIRPTEIVRVEWLECVTGR